MFDEIVVRVEARQTRQRREAHTVERGETIAGQTEFAEGGERRQVDKAGAQTLLRHAQHRDVLRGVLRTDVDARRMQRRVVQRTLQRSQRCNVERQVPSIPLCLITARTQRSKCCHTHTLHTHAHTQNGFDTEQNRSVFFSRLLEEFVTNGKTLESRKLSFWLLKSFMTTANMYLGEPGERL